MNSPFSTSQRSSRSSARASKSAQRLVQVKCSFCGNTFYDAPREALCRKCNRPANKPLAPLLRVVGFVAPPFGLVYAAVVRPHSPVAAMQSAVASALGAAVYVGAYAVHHLR